MPPKKKGKGKRRGKALSDEEKQKLQAQKALAERERVARRQKLIKAFLDIKKDREYELYKVNQNKILDLWRPILRKQKIQELLDDYKLMQLAFQRSYDKKNVYLDEMNQNLEKNEGEYDEAVDMHLHNIDKMLEFYYKRLGEVKDSFMKERNKLINSLDEERENIQERHEHSMQMLRDRMAAIERGFKQDTHDAKMEIFMKEEDLKNSVNQDLQAFRAMMQQKITELWNDIHQRVLGYEQNSNDKRKEYKKYREKDDNLSAIIDAQFTRLAALKDGLKQLDHRMNVFQQAFAKYFDELKAKKQECRDIYNALMKKQKELVTNSRGHIEHLAVVTHNVVEKMSGMWKTRQHILLAVERCHREETEEEQADPFMNKCGLSKSRSRMSLRSRRSRARGTQGAAPPGQQGAQGEGAHVSVDDPWQKYALVVPEVVHCLVCECDPCKCPQAKISKEAVALKLDSSMSELKLEAKESRSDVTIARQTIEDVVKEYSMLEMFWWRYNRVALDKEALRVRRKGLLDDNHNLRLTLRNYMGSLNPIGLDLVKFTDDLAAKDKRFMETCKHIMDREKKRKERCRKVGGVKVF